MVLQSCSPAVLQSYLTKYLNELTFVPSDLTFCTTCITCTTCMTMYAGRRFPVAGRRNYTVHQNSAGPGPQQFANSSFFTNLTGLYLHI